MKAIMISIKPKWCAKIMNGEKTIEVRKNKALANAIQKLIDEYGYADIYVHCSKGKLKLVKSKIKNKYMIVYPKLDYEQRGYQILNGKVLFKFRCYKLEEISYTYLVNARSYFIQSCLTAQHFSKECCLEQWELEQYLKGKKGYAIHISDLEIFEKPKKLSEFSIMKQTIPDELCEYCTDYTLPCKKCKSEYPLTKGTKQQLNSLKELATKGKNNKENTNYENSN